MLTQAEAVVHQELLDLIEPHRQEGESPQKALHRLLASCCDLTRPLPRIEWWKQGEPCPPGDGAPVVRTHGGAVVIAELLDTPQVQAAIQLQGEAPDRRACMTALLGDDNRDRINFAAGLAVSKQMYALAVNLLRLVGSEVPAGLEERAAAEQKG